MGDVVRLPGITRLPLDPDVVLQGNVGNLDEVLILGTDKEGEFFAATSKPDIERLVWLAQRFIHKAMNGDYTDG
jgi:hypothetical protein